MARKKKRSLAAQMGKRARVTGRPGFRGSYVWPEGDQAGRLGLAACLQPSSPRAPSPAGFLAVVMPRGIGGIGAEDLPPPFNPP